MGIVQRLENVLFEVLLILYAPIVVIQSIKMSWFCMSAVSI